MPPQEILVRTLYSCLWTKIWSIMSHAKSNLPFNHPRSVTILAISHLLLHHPLLLLHVDAVQIVPAHPLVPLLPGLVHVQ